MRASRGMGAVNPDKMPKGRKILRKDALEPVEIFQAGGAVGLYDNINAKRKRIASGSGERMRKPGTAGAPTAQAFVNSAKTARTK